MLPLVFLPGMMCDARLYEHQLLTLSKYTTVQVARVYHKPSFTELARDTLDNAPPRFILIGLSMGGILAMEMLAQKPERIRGVVLLDTNPLAESAEIRAIREEQIELVQSGGLKGLINKEVIPRFELAGKNKNRIAATFQAMALELGEEVFVNQSRALQRREDQQETLKKLRIPTLIICGEKDMICPLDRHLLMHELITGSRLEIIAEAGHLPTLEQPERTTALIKEWLLEQNIE